MSGQRSFTHDMKNMLGIVIGYSNLVLEDMPRDDKHRPDLEEIRKAGEKALALLEGWHAPVPGDDAA